MRQIIIVESIGPMLPWIRKKQISKKAAAVGIFLLLAGFFIFVIRSEAFAQTQIPTSTQNTDVLGIESVEGSIALGGSDIRVIIARIIRVFLGLLGIITVGIIVYAGGLIMLSGGDEGKVAQGKRILANAVIGLIIILASFSIAHFVLLRLQQATGRLSTGRGGGGIQLNTFFGSGALGTIITDHYPFVNETNVPRNAKIVVTFRESVQPQSLIRDNNGNGVFGDCVVPAGQVINWALHCDRMVTTSARLFISDQPTTLFDAAALSTVQADGTYHTFVFRPLQFLGTDTSTVQYTVALTDQILRGDGRETVFATDRDRQYQWRFETGTDFDFSPPSVVGLYPIPNQTVARNTIFQIHFNEPVDPSTVQGQTGNFTHILFGVTGATNRLPQGEWRVTNGYRTAEFVPLTPCGQNSCGDTMYCIDLDCANPNDQTCTNGFVTLARTADLITNNPDPTATDRFQATPFTGVMDLAGNALDSGVANAQGIPVGDGRLATPHKPQPTVITQISANELVPDNIWWQFTIQNTIDRRVPHVQQMTPGIDQEEVDGQAPLEMIFNLPLWFGTLRDIAVEEFPAGVNGLRSISYNPRGELVTDSTGTTTTRVELRHREFGPNDTDLYYFVSVPSQVRAVNQNCVYPGRGPIADVKATAPSTCAYQEDLSGNVIVNQGCAPVTVNDTTDTACIQTTQLQQGTTDLRLQQSVATCLQLLRQPTISSSTSP